MASCFWSKCTCPDVQPCPEHTGLACGRWGGLQVTAEAQVADAVTRDAELAIIRLDEDQRRLDTVRARMEQRRDELQRERDDLARALESASTFGERRAAARQLEAAYRRAGDVQAELQQVMTDLASISAGAGSAGGLISTYLIVPYTSGTGYCDCYTDKCNRLAALAGQRAVQVAALGPLFAQKATLSNQFFGAFGQVPNPANVLRVTSSLTFLGVIAAFLLFGIKGALIALIVGGIAIIVILLAILLMLIDIDAQIMRIRQQIVRLDLTCYRQQAISTCIRGASATTRAPGGGPGDDNAWWWESGLVEPPGGQR